MSNPNPVNLNNLDGRYTKPADVSALISAQAMTDAGQYVTIGTQGSPIALSGIGKSTLGSYRILQLGTSIAYGSGSPNTMMVQHLQNLFGQTTTLRLQTGVLGGDYNNPYNGWYKQPFSGISYTRLRGSSTSSTLTNVWQGYGDQVVIEWSQEADSAATTVLVDGASVGSFGAPGSQKFGVRTIFNVSKGSHLVSIQAPTSGYSYIEAIEVRDSARRGVETINGTMGGSSLAYSSTPSGTTGSQVSAITTTKGAGIEALFGRDDVDLIIMSFTVNDAGYNINDPTAADYRQLLENALITARRQGVPVILQIEPAGSYALSTPNGDARYNARYTAVKNHQLAMPSLFPNVYISDWDSATRKADIAVYAAAYYPSVSNLNVSSGTWTGDFIHPDYTITPSSQSYGIAALAISMGIKGSIPTLWRTMVDLEISRYSRPFSAQVPLSAGIGGQFSRKLAPCYRDGSQTNYIGYINTDIANAGTVNANGKYLLANNYNINYLGGATNTIRMLTLRLGPNDSGNISILANDSGTRFYCPDGTEIAAGAANSTKQFQWVGLSPNTIFTFSVLLSQDTANKYFTINGRIYEGAVTSSNVPLLVTAP